MLQKYFEFTLAKNYKAQANANAIWALPKDTELIGIFTQSYPSIKRHFPLK
jgi:hypothetical protein